MSSIKVTGKYTIHTGGRSGGRSGRGRPIEVTGPLYVVYFPLDDMFFMDKPDLLTDDINEAFRIYDDMSPRYMLAVFSILRNYGCFVQVPVYEREIVEHEDGSKDYKYWVDYHNAHTVELS